MKQFHLPDLGEGLPDAEIHEWHVHEGEEVDVDQLLVSMETAKAVVEVPSPFKGKIAKLHGKVGDILLTGATLVEFFDEDHATATPADTSIQKPKSLTVAGDIEIGDEIITEAPMGVTPRAAATESTVKILPAVRALAARLGVDLSVIKGSGPAGQILQDDVKRAKEHPAPAVATASSGDSVIPLRGVRRTMAQIMAQSHAQVVPVVLVDDADISDWEKHAADITVRLLRALAYACKVEPALNAHYDGNNMVKTLKPTVNVGLAMDSPEGLFVPVLKAVEQQHALELRAQINAFKQQVKERSIAPEDLRDASIALSNFGVFAGRYANPIVVPPTIAIVAIGKIRDTACVHQGEIKIRRILPLSLSFDHRAATGGEASRFLGAMIEDLAREA